MRCWIKVKAMKASLSGSFNVPEPPSCLVTLRTELMLCQCLLALPRRALMEEPEHKKKQLYPRILERVSGDSGQVRSGLLLVFGRSLGP